jgi:hypothetical protein
MKERERERKRERGREEERESFMVYNEIFIWSRQLLQVKQMKKEERAFKKRPYELSLFIYTYAIF